jgi:hypothetical protein
LGKLSTLTMEVPPVAVEATGEIVPKGTVTVPSDERTEKVTVSPAKKLKLPEASVTPEKPDGVAA